METLKFKVLVSLAILISINANAVRLSKKVYRNFPVASVQKLQLSNKYGNIYIENSRTDSVIVSADIWVEGNSDKSSRILSSINVTVNQNGNTVEAATTFDKMNNWNTEFSVDYHIEIPADRELAVEQKYGSVNMRDLTGKGTFEIKYGELNGQKLISPELSIDVAYSKIYLKEVMDLSLALHYSKLKVGKGNNLKIEARYSGISISECNQLDIDSKYDNMSIGNIASLKCSAMYTECEIDKLSKKLTLVNGYGGFSAKQITAGFESITIENKYAGIKLGIEKDAAYQLNGTARYSIIKHPEGQLNVIRELSNYLVNGTIGNSGNSGSRVTIATSYGVVNLIP
jgi:hypothetical protein